MSESESESEREGWALGIIVTWPGTSVLTVCVS